MKPSDFFITSRQFFGLLIPGTLWVAALALFIFKYDILQIVNYAGEANLAGILAFLAVAFVMGALLQYPSFALAERCSKGWYLWTHRKGRVDPHLPQTSEHRKRVQQVIHDRYGKPEQEWKPLWGVQPHADLSDDQEAQHELFALCKRSILTRSPVMAKRLLDHEDEINLLGMLLLPSTVLAISLLIRVRETSELHLRGGPWEWAACNRRRLDAAISISLSQVLLSTRGGVSVWIRGVSALGAWVVEGNGGGESY